MRHYYSPFPKLADLVLAGRLAYSVQSGAPPFFIQDRIHFTDGERSGLGGKDSLRGYRIARFVGPVKALANFEMRYVFYDVKLGSQLLEFMLVPFVDFGRVFDSVARTSLNDWKTGYGTGLRIAWNQATVIIFDYGRSSEGGTFYFIVGQIF